MTAESKKCLVICEDIISFHLKPLGFKKKRARWSRTIDDVFQQFSIVSKKLYESYRPEWGLNIVNRCDDSKLNPSKLHVHWLYEMSLKNVKQSVAIGECFDFSIDLADGVRRHRINGLLKKHVIPCFEAFTTEESI